MEDGQMIEIIENPNNGNGFDVLHTFEGWKVAFLTYADQFDELKVIKRHTLTDEAFLLIKGSATMYTASGNEPLKKTEMEKDKLYIVKKNIWHHVKVSEDALIFVVENSNTTKENSEAKILTEEEIKEQK